MTDATFEFINPRYLSGISDEPKQLLQPISGYAREPLLSLEEACEPLGNIVPRLQAHVWIAKQNSKNPADGLTQDESAAIRLYTMEWDAGVDEPRSSLYSQLNHTLKQIDRTKLRPWFRYLKLFLTALAKIPPVPRQTVWRGVRKNHTADYPQGEQATWWAFSSCTASLNVLESDLYLGNAGTRTLFSIETFNGRNIQAHSHFQAEDEILLLPGTYFEIKSRLNPAADLYIIHLSQKRPPHDLLEPPFEGAELLPSTEAVLGANPRRDTRTSMDVDNINIKDDNRPWYKNNIVRIAIIAFILAVILAIILGAVLGTRSKGQPSGSMTNSSIDTSLNGSIPDPVSVANAFYSFDDNTFDLYSTRDGEVIGGPVRYVQGFVTYGKAIALTQTTATYIQMKPGFNSSIVDGFTIEGFFLLQETQLNATLVQLTPTITVNIFNGELGMYLGSNIIIIGRSVLSTDQWHHFAFVYDGIQQIAKIYIDGKEDQTRSSVKPDMTDNNMNSSIIVGAGFHGYIDQLSIKLQAKSPAVIVWDATTTAYYPLDIVWALDKGPNGLNATSSNINPIFGWRFNAINFNLSNAYFKTNSFIGVAGPRNAFSVALWVRVESRPGIFLTLATQYTCLLVVGLQSANKDLIAYLPKATSSGSDVTVYGPQMPSNAWVHVAFTWSVANGAQLYTSGFLQGESTDPTNFSNARGGNSTTPMTITLGYYNSTASCQAPVEADLSSGFIGSIDELYVFSRELTIDEINRILTVYPT